MSDCIPIWRPVFTAALLPALTLCAQDTRIDYEQDVRPLLHSRCVSCHGPLRSQSGLRLDTARLLLRGGDSGTAAIPGDAVKSLLVKRISTSDPDLRMPPDGDPLNADEIGTLTRWIAAGAEFPASEVPLQNPQTHWAFSVPVEPEIPGGSDASHAIDAFLSRQRRQRGLTPAPRAQPGILLRRVSLDLIGLPPTPEQIAAFNQQPDEREWKQLVDTLLSSPHYGERWGRHWMDIWRYSDWYGYRTELRNSARHLWRWRDWIIDSISADKPYNRMILEMLAGDELAPGSPDTVRATGFLARHYFKFNRDTWLNATVEHTAKAFVGLTLNCARCHDHMYDPFTMRDYYSFRAIFEPYRVRIDRVPGQSDTTRDGLSLAYDADPEKLTYLYLRGNDKRPDRTSPVAPALPAFFATDLQPDQIDLPPEAWYPGVRDHIQQEALKAALATVKTRTDLTSSAMQALNTARDEYALSRARRPPPLPELRDPSSPEQLPHSGNRTPFFTDSFIKRNQAWEFGPGRWEFGNNRLRQSATGASRRTITLKELPPRNFTATFRFRILGGERWKSVGLDFDRQADETSQSVYISAYAGGPKVQYSHRQAGKTIYPPGAAQSLPVQLNRTHTLQVAVHDSLLNVNVDGRLSLAIELPVSRRSGRISLWAFDAAAEFLSVKIETLSGPVQLVAASQNPVAAGTGTIADPAVVLASARLSLEAAQLELHAARLNVEFHRARTDADAAEFGRSPDADVMATARNAARLSREHALAAATALVKRRQAEQAALELKPEAEKARAIPAALQAVASARKQLAELEKNVPDSETVSYPRLTETYPRTSTGRRLALARWIASRHNPLTARVAVNHVWMRHFGEPLVDSVFDFGLKGSAPSHPELLDWLAVDFMKHDWSMKHLHRRILTSAAWQMQSSSRHPTASMQAALAASAQIDPDNRWLWRAVPRRVESEIVRDCILAVSGKLDITRGGPELDQQTGLTTTRRSIYYRHAPEKQMTFLTLFDAASTDECYRRNETVVPQQALALVNSQLTIEQSRHLTALLHQKHSPGSTSAGHGPFIRLAFLRILGRTPSVQEFSECRKFLGQQTARFRQGTGLTGFGQGVNLRVAPSPEPVIRSRENLAHVLLNHNDFITVR